MSSGVQARRHRPGDDVGEPVLADEGSELLHAVLDIAHHPGLRDAVGLGDALDAAMAAGFLAEAMVDIHAPPLGHPHLAPVALAIVGHQAGLDDADAMAGWIAAFRLELRRQGSSDCRRGPCGSRLAPTRAARSAPASDIAATQSGGPPGCT